jgi:hypothetical protein
MNSSIHQFVNSSIQEVPKFSGTLALWNFGTLELLYESTNLLIYE